MIRQLSTALVAHASRMAVLSAAGGHWLSRSWRLRSERGRRIHPGRPPDLPRGPGRASAAARSGFCCGALRHLAGRGSPCALPGPPARGNHSTSSRTAVPGCLSATRKPRRLAATAFRQTGHPSFAGRVTSWGTNPVPWPTPAPGEAGADPVHQRDYRRAQGRRAEPSPLWLPRPARCGRPGAGRKPTGSCTSCPCTTPTAWSTPCSAPLASGACCDISAPLRAGRRLGAAGLRGRSPCSWLSRPSTTAWSSTGRLATAGGRAPAPVRRRPLRCG